MSQLLCYFPSCLWPGLQSFHTESTQQSHLTWVSLILSSQVFISRLTRTSLIGVMLSEDSERSVTEVVIRTIATHIFALAKYGHFGSLLNLPGDLHAGYTIVFLFFPPIITGQLALGLLQAIRYRIRESEIGTNGASFGFYLHGALGVHVVRDRNASGEDHDDSDERVPLFHAGHLSVRRTPRRMSWKHIGRILACMTVIVQATGTAILFVRRFTLFTLDRIDQSLVLDVFNGLAAFCSAIAGIGSLAILLSPYEWRVVSAIPPVHASDREKAVTLIKASTMGYLWSGVLRGFYWYSTIIGFIWSRMFELTIVATLVAIFRKDIQKRAGLYGRWIEEAFWISLASGMISDVVALLVVGIFQIQDEGGGWKDPWSDMLLVV
jgi:hypothetical protein